VTVTVLFTVTDPPTLAIVAEKLEGVNRVSKSLVAPVLLIPVRYPKPKRTASYSSFFLRNPGPR